MKKKILFILLPVALIALAAVVLILVKSCGRSAGAPEPETTAAAAQSAPTEKTDPAEEPERNTAENTADSASENAESANRADSSPVQEAEPVNETAAPGAASGSEKKASAAPEAGSEKEPSAAPEAGSEKEPSVAPETGSEKQETEPATPAESESGEQELGDNELTIDFLG